MKTISDSQNEIIPFDLWIPLHKRNISVREFSKFTGVTVARLVEIIRAKKLSRAQAESFIIQAKAFAAAQLI